MQVNFPLKILFLIFCCFSFPYKALAINPTVKGNSILYTTDNGTLRIQMCSEGMFRVTKTPDGIMPDNEKWMVERYDFTPVAFQIQGNSVTTSRLRIQVDPEQLLISVADSLGNTLYQETGTGIADSIYNEVATCGSEHFFGLGERMDALDQQGRRVHLNVELGRGPKPAVGGKDILRANYCPVPLLLSNKGYAIFFHTAVPNDWDLGWSRQDRYSFSSSGGDNDYYFILGPSIQQMLQGYHALTGHCPLMPMPAYGLHIGSYSGGTWKHERNTSDTYVVNLIHKLRGERIPFDLMWLDSTWRIFTSLGNGGCSFEFQDTFKDPKGMIDTATANHVAMFGLHIRSLLDNGLHNTLLTDARKKGFTIQDGHENAILNFFDDKAVNWWWKNAAGKVTRYGVKFFKTDVGSALWFKDATPEQQALHNLFPIAYAKAPYELFSQLNRQRGFDHTREGYAGIQRYPFIWAGDWGSEWQWFEPVIRGGLNIGLSGVGYWSHCMGGFEQYSPYDTDLYIRWCQFGMFSPVAMLFGMDHPRYHAPWTYGEEAERIFITYDSLRYSLLPYIYTSAHEMYTQSRPIMAPLLYDHLQDPLTYNISDQYMFGPSMMVCPVTVKGALSRAVYFPGSEWVDFWTGERLSGRRYKSFLTPQHIMPIFLKAGCIIPQQQAMQYVGEHPADTITLLTFPRGRSSYQLYEDDGTTTDYQQGSYALTDIESNLADGRWTLTVKAPQGSFTPPRHTFSIVAYLDRKPQTITLNGKPISSWTFDEQQRKAFITTSAGNEATFTLVVE
jgi:alpha-glucosidase